VEWIEEWKTVKNWKRVECPFFYFISNK
jgi:hypothetical protein